MMNIIISPTADLDIESIEDYYESISSGLGKDFLLKLHAILERIRVFPKIYAMEYRNVRAARVRDSQYVMYYVIRSEDEIVVIAVIHGARDASVWQSRIH